MEKRSAPLWNDAWPVDLEQRLEGILAPAAANAVEIFFRADDIGAPDAGFRRLMHLFRRHRMPLCLAVVPAWIDRKRWRQMQEFTVHDPLWCWHQHGLCHANHQESGRKSEFGSHRSCETIRSDLVRGREHLQAILGPAFFPVFTPPWNRCSLETLQILAREGYAAVSRTVNARPAATSLIPDLAVAVDLHTRKEQDPALGWQNLLDELACAADSGRIGIMIHHQLMNDRCFAFLDLFLALCRGQAGLCPGTFRDLLSPVS
ncbi:MAG TPA: polysaccharide deacetylase [Desulfobulbus sp.]|nr:polysaccharide deacetylase [Desulfobulbus sp.]